LRFRLPKSSHASLASATRIPRLWQSFKGPAWPYWEGAELVSRTGGQVGTFAVPPTIALLTRVAQVQAVIPAVHLQELPCRAYVPAG
jgi:hypothetical protein